MLSLTQTYASARILAQCCRSALRQMQPLIEGLQERSQRSIKLALMQTREEQKAGQVSKYRTHTRSDSDEKRMHYAEDVCCCA